MQSTDHDSMSRYPIPAPYPRNGYPVTPCESRSTQRFRLHTFFTTACSLEDLSSPHSFSTGSTPMSLCAWCPKAADCSPNERWLNAGWPLKIQMGPGICGFMNPAALGAVGRNLGATAATSHTICHTHNIKGREPHCTGMRRYMRSLKVR